MALLDGEVWHQPQKVDRKSVLKSLGLVTGRWDEVTTIKSLYFMRLLYCVLQVFRTLNLPNFRESNFELHQLLWRLIFLPPTLAEFWPKSRITKLRTFFPKPYHEPTRNPTKIPNFEFSNIVQPKIVVRPNTSHEPSSLLWKTTRYLLSLGWSVILQESKVQCTPYLWLVEVIAKYNYTIKHIANMSQQGLLFESKMRILLVLKKNSQS